MLQKEIGEEMKKNNFGKSQLPGWKTIQFFIFSSGVSEVQIFTDSSLRCSCDGFETRGFCRHVNWCKSRLSNGMYPIEITSKVIPREEIDAAEVSVDAFRELILKYGKPLVL